MNDDLISRDAVLDACSQSINILDAMSRIEDLPSVTPKQRKGHWIKRYIIGKRNIEMIVCSECGEEFSYDAETGVSHYDYCPNCGAKMEEQE